MKDNKNKLLMTLLIVLFGFIGSSLAFFENSYEDEKALDIHIHSSSVEYLNFDLPKTIGIHATTSTFTQGGKSLDDSVTAKVQLMSYQGESTAKTLSYKYNVYFNILENDFIYTVDSTKPELILTVTGPGGEITKLNDLNYHTKDASNPNDVSGFDVTKATGPIAIQLDQVISTSSYVEQSWKFTLTLVNLTTNQFGNNGHHIKAEIITQQDKI